ncbi:hypothetical protein V8H18_11785 [Lautropia mirabilis]
MAKRRNWAIPCPWAAVFLEAEAFPAPTVPSAACTSITFPDGTTCVCA